MFGPREYLVDPPIQPTSPQSQSRTFKPSGATGNACTSPSGNAKDASINLFMSWFETISANLNEKVKQRALFACQEVASMIAEELCDKGRQAEATHRCLNARRVEYCTETVDIRIVHLSGGPTSRRPADSGVGDQQGQLKEFQNKRDSSQQAPKHG